MRQLPDFLIFPIVTVALVLLALAIALLPMLLFFKVMERITTLEQQGDTEAAYRLAQKLVPITRLPFARKAVGEGMLPLLLLQLARLAEASGELEASMDWAKRVSGGEFDSGYQSIALQYQATLLRKQNRDDEAESMEAKALALPTKTQLDNDTLASKPSLEETAHITILYSQGRFHEALGRIDSTSVHASDVQQIALAEKKAIILRSRGDYDDALKAQQEVETRFEAMRSQWSSSFTTNTAINTMLRGQHRKALLANRMMRILLCLEGGKIGAASETWDTLPPEVVDGDTEALRYATGAWLFAARGDADTARRLITDLPTGSDGEKQTAIHILIGHAQFALHDYDAAAEQFRNVISACKGKPLAQAENRALLATCYVKQEKYDLARAEYETVIAAGFEEAAFTRQAREQLARLKANDATDGEAMRLPATNR